MEQANTIASGHTHFQIYLGRHLFPSSPSLRLFHTFVSQIFGGHIVFHLGMPRIPKWFLKMRTHYGSLLCFPFLWVLTHASCHASTITISHRSLSLPFNSAMLHDPTPRPDADLFTISIALPFPDSCKWKYTVCCLFGLGFFTLWHAFKIHPCCLLVTHFFLFLYILPLYGHNFFLHSPIEGHLGGFVFGYYE